MYKNIYKSVAKHYLVVKLDKAHLREFHARMKKLENILYDNVLFNNVLCCSHVTLKCFENTVIVFIGLNAPKHHFPYACRGVEIINADRLLKSLMQTELKSLIKTVCWNHSCRQCIEIINAVHWNHSCRQCVEIINADRMSMRH